MVVKKKFSCFISLWSDLFLLPCQWMVKNPMVVEFSLSTSTGIGHDGRYEPSHSTLRQCIWMDGH
jgi:hypothetical protein